MTVLHSLWQGVLLGIVVSLLLMTLRRASAALRHIVALIGLAMFAVIVVATAGMIGRGHQPTEEFSIDNHNRSSVEPEAEWASESEKVAFVHSVASDGVSHSAPVLPLESVALPESTPRSAQSAWDWIRMRGLAQSSLQ